MSWISFSTRTSVSQIFFFCRGWKAFFRVFITLYALLGWGSWVIKGPKIGPHVSWFWSFPTDLWNLLSYDQSCNRFQNTLLHRWCTSISLFSGYSQSDSNAYHKMTTSCISLIYNTEKLCWWCRDHYHGRRLPHLLGILSLVIFHIIFNIKSP